MLLLTGLATVALIVLFFVVDAPADAMPANTAAASAANHDVRLWLQDAMFSKADLRLGRLITSAVVFTFLFLSVTVFWRQLRRVLGWLLLPLGQHALYAYTAHIAIIALVSLALSPFKVAYPGPQWLNAAIQIGSVLLIWSPGQVAVLGAHAFNQATVVCQPGGIRRPSARRTDGVSFTYSSWSCTADR